MKNSLDVSRTKLASNLFALLVFAILFCPRLGAQTSDRVLAIVGGTLIDGTGAGPQQDVTVIVHGERIERIGPLRSTAVPAGATVIQGNGKFILPGFIDAHIHYRDYFPELLITYGITSCSEWGGSPLEWELAQRDGINAGKIYGPRIYTGGENIGSPAEKSNVDAALRHVRALAAAGVNKIDIDFDVAPEVVTAVVHEAHMLGLPVDGYPVHAREAIEAGIDAIKHTYMVGAANVGLTNPSLLPELYKQAEFPDRDRDERLFLLGKDYGALVKLMVEHKTVWVPTILKDFKTINDRRDEFLLENYRLLSNPELQYLPVADLMLQVTNEYRSGLTVVASGLVGTTDPHGEEFQLYQDTYRNLQGLMKALVQAGGHVLAGTAPHSFVLPGVSLHQEMQLFVDAGLTPMQALQSASLWVAEYLRAQKDIGSVEVGKFADIIILAKNPLEDIRNTRTVTTVIQGGRVLPTGYHHDYVNPIPRLTEMNAPGVGFGRPRLDNVSPAAIEQGAADLQIELHGRNFAPDATAMFEKTPLKTQYVSPTLLKATIPARWLQQVGNYSIRVWNPRPGGGDSVSVSFLIDYRNRGL